MRFVLIIMSGLLLVSMAVPTLACINDRETVPYEREYQERYEPEEYDDYGPLAHVDMDIPFRPNLTAIAGMGVGTVMLITGLVVPAVLWRNRR